MWLIRRRGGGTCYLVVEILVTATTSYLCHARGIAKLSGFELIYKVIKFRFSLNVRKIVCLHSEILCFLSFKFFNFYSLRSFIIIKS